MQTVGSGDWINLAEAAVLCSEAMRTVKTPEDVIKIGYMDYLNIPEKLRIYTFPMQHVAITPHDFRGLEDLLPNQVFPTVTDEEKALAFTALSPGQMYEIHPEVLERLLIMRAASTADFAWTAVIRLSSWKAFPGWSRVPSAGDDESGERWKKVFDGVISPAIDIRWDDLRVDRLELIELLREAMRDAGRTTFQNDNFDPYVAALGVAPGATEAPQSRVGLLPSSADNPLNRPRPRGGDSLTPVIWDICYELDDQGIRVTAIPVMAALKRRAKEKIHPLVGDVNGGVAYEHESGSEKELDNKQLHGRIREWRKANSLART